MGIKDNFSNPKGRIGRMMVRTMNIGHTPMAIWTLRQFEWPVKADILDIGCGGGVNIKRMLKLCPQGRVLGLDISEESVAESRRVNKKELGKRCKIYQGNVEALPFKDACLDIVTAFETIYFWPDLRESFKEIRRVLKPNGKFIISCDSGNPNKHWEGRIPNMKSYTPELLETYLKDAGFSQVVITSKRNMICVCGYAE